jgi:hypothetical protein
MYPLPGQISITKIEGKEDVKTDFHVDIFKIGP